MRPALNCGLSAIQLVWLPTSPKRARAAMQLEKKIPCSNEYLWLFIYIGRWRPGRATHNSSLSHSFARAAPALPLHQLIPKWMRFHGNQQRLFFSFFKLNTRVGLYSLISVGSLRSKLGALFHSVTHRQKRGVEPSLMTGLSEPATTETMSRYHR